jgi:tape measure domain-containing protein
MADSELERLLVIIDASTEGLRRELKKAEKSVDDTSSMIAKAQRKMGEGWKKSSKWVEQHNNDLKLLGAAAVGGTALALKAIINYSDSYKNLTGQLKLVTDSQENLNYIWDEALQISNRTGASMDATVTLYARMARSSEQLGISQSDLLSMTETVNQAFAVSGATAEEAKNAIIQLAQGMDAGALRSEEFNSVNEQGVRIMQLIADEMGVARGELKDLAAEGAITTEVITRALKNGAEVVQEEYDKLPVTVERAMNRIRNAMLNSLGRTDMSGFVGALEDLEALFADENFVKGLEGLAEAIVKVGTGALQALAHIKPFTDYLAETLAAAIQGAAFDDLPRLYEQLASAELELKNTKYGVAFWKDKEKEQKRLRQEIKDLKALIALNLELVNSSKKLGKQNKNAAKDKEEEAEATGSLVDKTEELDDALEDYFEQEEKREEKIRETVEALEEEGEAIGRSAELQAGYNALAKAGVSIDDERALSIMRVAMANHRLEEAYDELDEAAKEAQKAQEEAAEEVAKKWEEARETLSDFFFEFARDGEDAFDTLTKGFEAMLNKMAADAASGIIIDIAQGTVTYESISAGVQEAAWAVFLNALVSSVTDGFTNQADNFFTNLVNNAASASWKPLEWFGAPGFNEIFGSDNKGNQRGSARFDLSSGDIKASGIGKNFDPKNVDAANILAQTLLQLASGIGGSEYSGRVIVGGDSQYTLNGKEFSSPEKFLEFGFDEVIRGATGLDESLKELLISFDDTAENVVLFAGEILALDEALKDNPVGDAIQDFVDAGRSALEVYRDSALEVNNLIASYDGSLESTQDLNRALGDAQTAAYDATQSILALSQSLTEMLGSQSEYFRESIMSPEELQAMWETDRKTLIEEIAAATDPAEVEKLVQEFIKTNRQLWDSLTEAEQKSRIGEFLAGNELVEDTAQGILGKSLEEIESSMGDIQTTISTEILNAAADLQNAAEDMGGHVDRFGDYIQTLVTNGINIRIETTAGELV